MRFAVTPDNQVDKTAQRSSENLSPLIFHTISDSAVTVIGRYFGREESSYNSFGQKFIFFVQIERIFKLPNKIMHLSYWEWIEALLIRKFELASAPLPAPPFKLIKNRKRGIWPREFPQHWNGVRPLAFNCQTGFHRASTLSLFLSLSSSLRVGILATVCG